MALPIKKGVSFDCSMFDVRCTQECVSGGTRHTDKCPYNNYAKGEKEMAKYRKNYTVKQKEQHYIDIIAKEKNIVNLQNPKVSYAKGYNKAVNDCRAALLGQKPIKSKTPYKPTKSLRNEVDYTDENFFLNEK